MTINYTTLLGLAKPVTGTETGQWGDIVNDEITSLLEDSIAKSVTLNVTSANVTLTTSNGATNQARMATLIITGTPGTTRNIIAPSQSKIYQVINQSDSSVVIKGAATTGVTILAGASGVVAWNGSDFIEIGAIASNRTVAGNFTVNGNTTLGDSAADVTTVAGNFTVNGTALIASGTAAAPSLTTTGDTNTGLYFPAADTVAIATGGAQQVVVNSAGNLGIGTTIAFAKLSVNGGIYAAGGNDIQFGNVNNTNAASINSDTSDTSSTLVFKTAAAGLARTEAARITSDRNLLVGLTSVPTTGNVEGTAINAPYAGDNASLISAETITGSSYRIVFLNGNGLVGSIVTGGSATAYNTSSDYRLKENIAPMTGALSVVQQLKPVTYTWKTDGSAGQGFIAHELQSVVPECVTGEKDAVDDEGNPKYQGIDTSFLVATLTAALQEAHGLIKDLQSRVAALEAK